MIRLQSSKASVDFLANGLGFEVLREPASCILQCSAFGEDVHFVTDVMDCIANYFLGSSPSREMGRINPIHTDLDSLADGLDCLGLILWSPIDVPVLGRANRGCADSNASDLEITFSQGDFLKQLVSAFCDA